MNWMPITHRQYDDRLRSIIDFDLFDAMNLDEEGEPLDEVSRKLAVVYDVMDDVLSEIESQDVSVPEPLVAAHTEN